MNFPTAGMNKLYFELDIGGARPLRWDKVEHEGIKAEITPDSTGS